MSNCSVCDCRPTMLKGCLYRYNNCVNTSYPRIYLQYNELVFSGISSVKTADLTGDFKIASTPYLFKHGSYAQGSFKNGVQLMGEQSLSLDLELPFHRLTRLQARNYYSHIQSNLSKPGRMWAVDTGGKLVWAFCIPKHPPYTDYELKNGNLIGIKTDFLLPEGVWHTANVANVFLEPWGDCDFSDYFKDGYDLDCTLMPDLNTRTCDLCGDSGCTCGPSVDDNMNWCNVCWNPYDQCINMYRIIYDELAGASLMGAPALGQQFKTNEGFNCGYFTSNSPYKSDVIVNLMGLYKDPSVTINDITVSVKGTFDGRLAFLPDGRVFYYKGEPCDEYIAPKRVKFTDIEYESNELGFSAQRGNNKFEVRNGLECGGAYNLTFIRVDELVS